MLRISCGYIRKELALCARKVCIFNLAGVWTQLFMLFSNWWSLEASGRPFSSRPPELGHIPFLRICLTWGCQFCCSWNHEMQRHETILEIMRHLLKSSNNCQSYQTIVKDWGMKQGIGDVSKRRSLLVIFGNNCSRLKARELWNQIRSRWWCSKPACEVLKQHNFCGTPGTVWKQILPFQSRWCLEQQPAIFQSSC